VSICIWGVACHGSSTPLPRASFPPSQVAESGSAEAARQGCATQHIFLLDWPAAPRLPGAPPPPNRSYVLTTITPYSATY